MRTISETFLAGVHSCLFMHGTGAARRGRAYLFVARSEGGKSTLSSVCDDEGLSVLGDEWQIVLERDGEFHLRPFARQAEAPPASLPLGPATRLRCVFFLAKGDDPKVELVSPMRATARCLRERLLWTFLVAGPEERLTALDRLIRLFRTVPAYVLHFRKDNSFWNVIDKLEEREPAR